MRTTKTCSAEGCPTRHFARGLCQRHYTRVLRTGSHLYKPETLSGGKSVSKAPTSKPGTVGPDQGNGPTNMQVRGMFAKGSSKVPQVEGVLVDGIETFRRGDRYQVIGVVCSDCHHHWTAKCGPACESLCLRHRPMGWCDSPIHPNFDITRRLVKD